MTFHINDFESPPGLDDDVLEGCDLHKVIDAVCTEPGCPNGPSPKDDVPPLALWTAGKADQTTPIYRTRAKMRCIL